MENSVIKEPLKRGEIEVQYRRLFIRINLNIW
jgi:hypothetical protein